MIAPLLANTSTRMITNVKINLLHPYEVGMKKSYRFARKKHKASVSQSGA